MALPHLEDPAVDLVLGELAVLAGRFAVDPDATLLDQAARLPPG
jgi:hypothetical protein